jgi:hypothetical protein
MAGELGQPNTGLSNYFGPAKNALQDMIKLFRQGGGYGAGQNAIIDTAANQAQAKAASDAVASGMSSGSLASSMGQRISSDTAKAKLGVEDTRTNFLAQAMQALSALYGQFGGYDSQERMNQANLGARGATTGGSTVSFGPGGDPANSFFNSSPGTSRGGDIPIYDQPRG